MTSILAELLQQAYMKDDEGLIPEESQKDNTLGGTLQGKLNPAVIGEAPPGSVLRDTIDKFIQPVPLLHPLKEKRDLVTLGVAENKKK